MGTKGPLTEDSRCLRTVSESELDALQGRNQQEVLVFFVEDVLCTIVRQRIISQTWNWDRPKLASVSPLAACNLVKEQR